MAVSLGFLAGLGAGLVCSTFDSTAAGTALVATDAGAALAETCDSDSASGTKADSGSISTVANTMTNAVAMIARAPICAKSDF